MRADEHAFAALDAQAFVPYRNLQRDIALLPLRGAAGKCAVNRHGAYRERVSLAGDDPGANSLDKFRRLGGYGRTDVKAAGYLARHRDLMQVVQSGIHGSEVLLDHRFAPLAIGLLNGALDGGNGLVPRQHTADGKEAGLHDGVDAAAHTRPWATLTASITKKRNF